MYDPLDNPSSVQFTRQRSPVDRNVYIRSYKHTNDNPLPDRDAGRPSTAWWTEVFLTLIAASMFGFALCALYDHALTRHSDPFNQEN